MIHSIFEFSMTIIKEEKLTVKNKIDDIFGQVKAQVHAAIKEETMQAAVDEEKKRVSRLGVKYSEFKDLVSTINLVPFRRGKI